MSFGDNLRRIRQARGYSRSELARLAELSTAAISQHEQGDRKPLLETARKLADALNVPIDALVRKE